MEDEIDKGNMMSGQQDKFAETAFWDRVARQRVYAAFDKDEYEAIIDAVWGANMEGSHIADIGSASGVSAALFAARGAHVTGIEIAPELVAQARELWRDYAERIEFVVGDAEHLELPDASLDAVFFGGVLHHIPQLEKVYDEAMRVLKPGGKFVAIEPNRGDLLELIEWGVADLRGKLTPNEYPIDPLAMKDDLRAAGFTTSRFWTVRHDIPVLAQIPVLKHFFSRQKGFMVKRPLLKVIDAFRPPECRGTFFVMVAERP
ncbi:MAG: class I SAM-dependent methyltransferase [Sideroxyarcus sp.]|nr:class I SAM-dependent methyltransferase [Sideroxyarcus sp.]